MDKVFSSLCLLDRLDLNFVIETKGFYDSIEGNGNHAIL
jgi:hypothetical protein